MSQYAPRFGAVVDTRLFKERYCGPGVLSVVTGQSYDQVEEQVNELRGDHPHKPITAMLLVEIKELMERFGLLVVDIPHLWVQGQATASHYMSNGSIFKEQFKCKTHATFITWLRETREARGQDVYLVCTGSHVMLACGDWIVDNCLKIPRQYEEIKWKRRTHIIGAFCILKDDKETVT